MRDGLVALELHLGYPRSELLNLARLVHAYCDTMDLRVSVAVAAPPALWLEAVVRARRAWIAT